MVKLHAQYLIDARGRRHAVQLPVREFRRLIEVLEDLEDIAYIKAHRHEPLIPMAKVHTSSASRQFRHVPREVTLSLQHAITSLAQNPRAMHTEKLEGYPNAYRLRVGRYRVLYTIEDDTRRVVIYRIAHRREAYR